MVFDLLHLDGWDVTGARLEDRKALLAQLLKAAPSLEPLKYSDHVIGAGPEFFAQACRLGLEGIVSKRRDAPYHGARTPDWLKIKCIREQEVVIGGYTDPEGSRVGIGALLAGVYEGGQLVFAGKVGTGFSDKTLRELHKQLRALEQDACPFTPAPTGLGKPALGNALAGRAGDVRRVDGRRSNAASLVPGPPRGQAAHGRSCARCRRRMRHQIGERRHRQPRSGSHPRSGPRSRGANGARRWPRWRACGSPMPTARCTRRWA